MRVTVEYPEGQEKVVDVKPKKEAEDEWFSRANELYSGDKEDVEAATGFLKFEDELVVKYSSVTQEEYDDLFLEDRQKLRDAMRKIIAPHNDLQKKN